MKRRFASLLGALVLLTGAVMMAGCPQSAKPDIQKYKITLKAGDHGTIAANPVLPKDGMVEQYTTLTFTATPNADYETEWAGAVPDADDKNKATLTVTADTMVTVTFKKRGSAAPGDNGQATETPNGFHIALSSGEHGSVQADSALPADGIVAKDTVLTFTAMPDTGYEVAAWTGATQDSADKNKARLTVTTHTTVSVTFKEKTADVSLLQIDSTGRLTGVTDRNALVGSLAIPNTVTGIGADAFVDCSKLTSVTMPETVTEIGNSAFSDCSALSAVTIGTGITKIGRSAFARCTNLTGITIPDSVTEIGEYAFWDCSALSAVTIGKNLTAFYSYTFGGCPKLSSITVDPDNATYCSVDNIIYTKDKTDIILVPYGLTGPVRIPDSVTEIGDGAFYGRHALSAVTIGAGVTEIGNGAFWNCSALSAVTIGDSVTEIGGGAFSNCSALNAVTIGARVTKIGNSAFAHCTNLTGITIPDSVTEIGGAAFFDCLALSTVTIGNSVTEIGGGAFRYCPALSAVTIGAGVTKIGNSAFAHCTNLTGITIPDSVTEIGGSAFWNCSALSTVTIGTGITKIESNAFSSCSSLGTITIKSSVLTDISNDAFSDIKSDAQFTVKTEAVKTLLNTQCNIEESKITVDENL